MFDCFKKKELVIENGKTPIPVTKPIDLYRHPRNTPDMVHQYESMMSTAVIRDQFKSETMRCAATASANKNYYQELAQEFQMPWEVIAVTNMKEAGFKLNSHLHNGDPLVDKSGNWVRTYHVPANRPPFDGPYTFFSSGQDAISYHAKGLGIDIMKYTWDVANTLFWLESYNGFGYRSHGVNTPYLWSYTQHYTKGHYVADGKYDAEAVAKSPGCVPVLLALNFKAER